MTFENTAWAIDGAQLTSSLARRAEYAAVGGAQGVVQKNDLKVTQLSVPGAGLLIEAGVGLLTNRYQVAPNETYVVSNPGTHTVPSSQMPATSGSARSFLLAIVVGDPAFSQAGHPWMPSTGVPTGEETTFQYVRPTLVQVASGVTTLPGSYPALVLARIDIPANTATITNAMITDLRRLARPQAHQDMRVSPANAWTNAAPARIGVGTSYADWGSAQFGPSVPVPAWAKRAIIVTSINGVRVQDSSVNISGAVRTQLGTVSGAQTSFDIPQNSGAVRVNLQTAGEYDVSSVAGQTLALRVEGWQNVPASPTTNQRLTLQAGSQVFYDVRFFEE